MSQQPSPSFQRKGANAEILAAVRYPLRTFRHSECIFSLPLFFRIFSARFQNRQRTFAQVRRYLCLFHNLSSHEQPGS